MPRPHVVDDAVVHRQVEVRGQAAGPAPAQGHDPNALQQADVQPVRCDESDLLPLRRPDGRAEEEAAPKAHTVRLEVDRVQVQLPLQVRTGFGVAGDDKPRAVGRPVEVRDVPCPVRQLLGVATRRGDREHVVIAAVDVPVTVVLVIEPPDHARHRRPAELLATFRWARVVDHGVWIGDDHPDEGEARAVG